MRRLLIGLCALALAAPPGVAAQRPQAERALEAAIAAARGKGPVKFRLRCAGGCVRPRATLAGLADTVVVEARAAACRKPRSGAVCFRLELERKSPPRWYQVDIETRPDAQREIYRVEITGP